MAFGDEWSDVGLGEGQAPEQALDYFKGKNKADLTTPTLYTKRPDEERALGLAVRGDQGEYAALLRAQMAGRGPSVARQQLAQGRDAAIRAGMATAAGARGANAAIAGRAAAQAGARGSMQAARDASLIKAQEQLAAQQQYGALLSGMRGQDLQARQISAAEEQARLNAGIAGLQTRATVGEGEASRGQLFGAASVAGLGGLFSDPDLKQGMKPLGPSHVYSPPETKTNMIPVGGPPSGVSDPYGSYSLQQFSALTSAAAGPNYGAPQGGMTPQGQTPGVDSTALQAQQAQSASWTQPKQQGASQGGIGGLLSSFGGVLGSDPALKEKFINLGMSPEQAHAEALKYSSPSPSRSTAPAYSPAQFAALTGTASGQENIPTPPGTGPSTNPYEIDRDLMAARSTATPNAVSPSAQTREGTTTTLAREAQREGGLGRGMETFGTVLGGGDLSALMGQKPQASPKPQYTPGSPQDPANTPAAQPAYSFQGYADDTKRQPGTIVRDNPYPFQKYGNTSPSVSPHEGEGEPYFVPEGKELPKARSRGPSKDDAGPPPTSTPPTAKFPLVSAAAQTQPVQFQYKEDAAKAQGVSTQPRVGISAERTPGSLADNPIYAPNVQHLPDGTAVVNVPMQTASLTAVTSDMARKQLDDSARLDALERFALGNVDRAFKPASQSRAAKRAFAQRASNRNVVSEADPDLATGDRADFRPQSTQEYGRPIRHKSPDEILPRGFDPGRSGEPLRDPKTGQLYDFDVSEGGPKPGMSWAQSEAAQRNATASSQGEPQNGGWVAERAWGSAEAMQREEKDNDAQMWVARQRQRGAPQWDTIGTPRMDAPAIYNGEETTIEGVVGDNAAALNNAKNARVRKKLIARTARALDSGASGEQGVSPGFVHKSLQQRGVKISEKEVKDALRKEYNL